MKSTEKTGFRYWYHRGLEAAYLYGLEPQRVPTNPEYRKWFMSGFNRGKLERLLSGE